MIQKELARKTGYSANLVLLIFVKKIGSNHICNSVTSSFPRIISPFLAMLFKIQYILNCSAARKIAEQGVTR